VATGGRSIPKMGATGFGYEVAGQFGLPLVEPVPALVPFTLSGALLEQTAELAGVSLPVTAACGKTRFEEAMLFTHRGVSGPAILQLSSYWSAGDEVTIDLLDRVAIEELIASARRETPKRGVAALLADHLPKRLAAAIVEDIGADCPLGQLSSKATIALAQRIHRWTFKPAGTEGWRTAEVTRGGVSTRALSSKTMECRTVAGLYFIGEVVDVTGHLGGFNFQWAWASGHAAGRVV
jgi:predicted Rossmann fold flavoprotein